jgi:hypothetical protein
MLEIGDYRIRIVSNEEGFNPGTQNSSYKGHWQIEDIRSGGGGHEIGDSVVMVQSITATGMSQIKAYVRHAAGYETEAEYDEFDPDGEFIDATTGEANEYSDRGETIDGRLVDVKVTRGKTRDDGDWYRNYAYTVVPEDEQT